MDSRNHTFGSAKGHRYGFNGKEKDEDGEWGDNTHYDYGFRIYNPAIAKFLSVDPLTKSYPELTPYQFASNTPIQAIDLDGLEAYFIHGLRSDGSAWQDPVFQDVKSALKKLTNNEVEYSSQFSWESKLPPRALTRFGNQGRRQRKRAAKKLVNFIEATFIEGAEITLVGVSDGGNVALQAAQMLNDKHNVKVNIITLNTPGTLDDFSENPNVNSGVNDLIQLSTYDDFVVTAIGGGVQNPGSDPKFEGGMLESNTEAYPLFRKPNGQVHATDQVDVSQIEELQLNKLDKVPKTSRLTMDKVRRFFSSQQGDDKIQRDNTRVSN